MVSTGVAGRLGQRAVVALGLAAASFAAGGAAFALADGLAPYYLFMAATVLGTAGAVLLAGALVAAALRRGELPRWALAAGGALLVSIAIALAVAPIATWSGPVLPAIVGAACLVGVAAAVVAGSRTRARTQG